MYICNIGHVNPFVQTVRCPCFPWSTRCSVDHFKLIMLENRVI